MEKKRDFLRKIIEEDLKSKKYNEVVTRNSTRTQRFPHHNGHAKSIKF